MNNNFLALPPELSDPESSKVHILPIPYDATVSYKTGAREGATAIINASRFLELFDSEFSRDFLNDGIHTLDTMEPEMAGPEKMTEAIRKAASKIIDNGKFLAGLGGEHSISIGLVKAHTEKYSNISVLQFDAHADLRDSFMGTHYSHACTMARIREFANVVQVGIRSLSEEEHALVRSHKIPFFSSEEVLFSEGAAEKIADSLSGNVYITFDLDVFDPSIMPSTGTPEPGGLDWYSVMKILKKVSQKRDIVGFDVVELSPVTGSIAPDFLAAKLVLKLLGYSRQTNSNSSRSKGSFRQGIFK